MGLSFVSRLLGILLLLFSFSQVPPIIVALIYRESDIGHFVVTLILSLLSGLLLWLLSRRCTFRVQTRDGFLIVTLIWFFVSLIGALPLMLSLHMTAAEAFFESASAFTTTGATVLSHLETIPRSILFYRQEMQWFGGIGVVVSAVALLPMLGIGGMQLYRAETAGPMKDEKLAPRITQTARLIWRIYAVMTLLCAVAFWAAGMEPFDALAHSLATVSTGGFSTYDDSLAHFHSEAVETVAIVFMLLGAISFNVHFLALRRHSFISYWKRIEVRSFLLIILLLTIAVAMLLLSSGKYNSPLDAFRYSAFETVSVITSTGFGIDNFSLWPGVLPVLLIFSSFIGGCAGSTSGGMKVVRFVLLIKQAGHEVLRLIHPRLVRQVKLDGAVVDERVVSAVWGFFAVYVSFFVLFMLLLMADGMDQVSAFGAVAACMNNLGPGLGKVAQSFSGVGDFTEWLMGFAMLLGRLEILTVLVLLSPAFWLE